MASLTARQREHRGAACPNVLTKLQTIDTYYATKFAKLVGMLDGIQNPDGSTLLDNTATVWFQDVSDGCALNLNNLPIIQAGSCGGYFKTGWTVNVDTTDTGSATLTQGNSESQCADGNASGRPTALPESPEPQRPSPTHRSTSTSTT